MFPEGSERLHEKAYLSMDKKASKHQIFPCALQSEYSLKNKK